MPTYTPPPVATSTPNYITGQVVAVSVAGKMAYCASGNCERAVNVIKMTNSRSGGYQEVRPGIKAASGQIECLYNGDDPPTGIVEGAYVTLIIDTIGYEISENQENYTGGTGNSATPTTPAGRILTVYALIEKINDQWSVDDSYKWNFSYQSSGAYTVADNATGATPTT